MPWAKKEVRKFEDDFKDDLEEEEREPLKSVLDLCSDLKLGNDSLSPIFEETLHKKWSFSLKISSVNVTKSEGNCGFGQIYWRNP